MLFFNLFPINWSAIYGLRPVPGLLKVIWLSFKTVLIGRFFLLTHDNVNSLLEIFSLNGANIFACARTIDDKFKKFCKELESNKKTKITPICIDLENEESIKKAAGEITNQAVTIDILINNAATIQTALFQMTHKKI